MENERAKQLATMGQKTFFFDDKVTLSLVNVVQFCLFACSFSIDILQLQFICCVIFESLFN